VFSDKTGTLTKNEMVFKKIAMESDQFTEASFNELAMILEDECKVNNAPMLDVVNVKDNDNNNIINEDERRMTVNKRKRRARTKVIRDTITAMVVCNNVTPIIEREVKNEGGGSTGLLEVNNNVNVDNNNNMNNSNNSSSSSNPSKITYQASSPDEVALVKFAEKLNMKLTYRTDKEIKFENATGFTEEYEILANFPFSSDTKRMGIVLKNKHHGHIIFYLKGAENVIEKFVKDEYKSYIRENAENLAMTGLRTLVLTQRIIPQDEFTTWYTKYNEALTSMENRKEKIASTISELEHNMDFLCVTGVEDLLQDEVNLTLENLRNAGMKIWMLTGDKIETAKCIAISAGLKAKNHKIYTIRYDEFPRKGIDSDINTMHEYLERYNAFHKDPHILIIDGDALDLALRHCEREFFETAMKAPSVVCCRCSPTQKCIIVKTIKKYTRPNERTAAVGDGGNDVAMIQEADVGVGIEGKEGLQASLASDFSLVKFCNLNTLILWWGRVSYKNTSTMANFVIHRGLIISFIQCLLSAMFYFNPVALYNGMLILGYGTLYTNFPAMSILLDSDSTVEMALCNPSLYRAITKGRELSMKMFLIWTWKSIYQSSVIMFGAVIIFEENIFLKIITVTFTVLIFAELLNVYLEIKKFNKEISIILFATCVTYLASLILFKSILDIYFIFDIKTFSRILLLAFLCWFPLYTFDKVKRMLWPSEINKLEMKELNKSKVTL
jgi:phospholipid-translocating ATPase